MNDGAARMENGVPIRAACPPRRATTTPALDPHVMKPLALASLLLAGHAVTAWAQPSVSATFGGTLASLRDGRAATAPQLDVNAAAGVEHLFRSERGRIYYDLDGGTFDSPGDWSYFLHAAGLTYRFGGAEAADRRIFLNASFALRRNGASWASADYSAMGVGLNAEFHPRRGVTLRTGYRVDRRSFQDLAELTQLEHGGFVSLLANFETRTTLIGEIRAGAKSYTGRIDPEAPVASQPVILAPQGHGPGQGMGPGFRTVGMTASQSHTPSGATGLVSGLVRLAQSLSDRTGTYVQTSVRTTFGAVPPELVTTPAGFFDDGVYDDPFASRATAVLIGVNREFGQRGAQLRASASWADRRFTNTRAVDAGWNELPGTPLRMDRVWRGSVSVSHPLFASRTGNAALTLDAGYRFTISSSNDAFYNYSSNGVGLWLSITY
jgi:hypothetical protein